MELCVAKAVYEDLGPLNTAVLRGFHCPTQCDTCGHIRGKSEKTAFKVFREATQAITTAQTLHETGKKAFNSVISGYE